MYFVKTRKAGLILLTIIGLIAMFVWVSRDPNESSKPKPKLIQNHLPNFVPQDLLPEKNQDLTVVADDLMPAEEAHRADISYESKLSVEENISSFRNHLHSQGFELETRDLEPSQIILASKEKTRITLTVWKRQPVQVSILYIILK